jgi:hypothetical protein
MRRTRGGLLASLGNQSCLVGDKAACIHQCPLHEATPVRLKDCRAGGLREHVCTVKELQLTGKESLPERQGADVTPLLQDYQYLFL